MYNLDFSKKLNILETIRNGSLQSEDTIQFDRKPSQISNMNWNNNTFLFQERY